MGRRVETALASQSESHNAAISVLSAIRKCLCEVPFNGTSLIGFLFLLACFLFVNRWFCVTNVFKSLVYLLLICHKQRGFKYKWLKD